jgi:hypothetical protein
VGQVPASEEHGHGGGVAVAVRVRVAASEPGASLTINASTHTAHTGKAGERLRGGAGAGRREYEGI